MEILVVSHKYPPSIGGMQKHCAQLVNGLGKKNVVHTIVQGSGSKFLFFLTVSSRIKKFLKDYPETELIYLNDGLMAFVVSKLIKSQIRPFAMTAHGLDVVFPLKFYQKWFAKYAKLLQVVIPVSEGTYQECKSRGVPQRKLQLIPNAIELPEESHKNVHSDVFEFKEGKKYIVSIGRSVPRKGYSWFIENVMSRLPEHIEYIMIGPGLKNHGLWRTFRSILPGRIFRMICIFGGVAIDDLEVQRSIKKLKLNHRVHRLKGLNDMELNSVLQQSDLFVMPNVKYEGDYEGFGLVILEAILNNVRVIGSDIDGISTPLSANNGILVDSKNEKEWVKKIVEAMHDPDIRSKEKEAYEATLTHFNIEKMVNAYEKSFQRAIEEGTR